MNEAIRQVTHVQNIRYDKATERLYIIDQTLLPNEEKRDRAAHRGGDDRGHQNAPHPGRAGHRYSARATACTRWPGTLTPRTTRPFTGNCRSNGELLGAARPTAVNLRWAVGEMLDTAKTHLNG